MKLTDLEPRLMKLNTEDHSLHEVSSVADANALEFLCPLCFQKNNGAVGTHAYVLYTPSVDQKFGGKGRWNFVGTSVNDLSLVNTPSSILNLSGCKAHFFITKGEIIMA